MVRSVMSSPWFLLAVCFLSSCRAKHTTIWAYYDYHAGSGKVSPFVELNLRTWRKHNPDFEIKLVNASNINEYIPDMPEEFSRISSNQARSDIFRAGVLYHQGGFYMDTDFLVMSSMAPVMAKLDEGWDIVSYGEYLPADTAKRVREDIPDGVCKDRKFSSNWHGGRKGNLFSKTWWTNIKAMLTRTCGLPKSKMHGYSGVCCHWKDTPSTGSCSMPFASLEHLKDPVFYPRFWKLKEDDIGKLAQVPEPVKVYCVNGLRTPIPHLNGEIYWTPWNAREGHTRQGPKVHYAIAHYKANCTEGDNLSLSCGPVQTRAKLLEAKTFKNFFGRMAYHLFFTTFHPSKQTYNTTATVLHHSWLVSDMYRRSLGMRLK